VNVRNPVPRMSTISSARRIRECLDMLRRFASHADGEAAGWLIQNDDLVGEVLISHLDRMTPADRLDLYPTLFGFFRRHYKSVVQHRLLVERHPRCRQCLATIEEVNAHKLNEPYSPTTDEDLIASSEKNLSHEDSAVRYLAAYALWLLTGDPSRVVGPLLSILKNPSAQQRLEAAALLGEIQPQHPDTIQTLREIANDPSDPVREAAKIALRACLKSQKSPEK
jgi:hypothetical protein